MEFGHDSATQLRSRNKEVVRVALYGDRTHLIPRRNTTKVMFPCVIEFHCANAYLRSSGRPTQDQIMLPACVVTGCRRVDGWAARAVSGPSVDVRANVHGWSAVATQTGF